MQNLDNTASTLDYIKIRCRNYSLGPTRIFDIPYEANAEFGQKDSIVKYLENLIEEEKLEINPTIAKLIDSMDANSGLIEAYCKALKSFIEDFDHSVAVAENLFADNFFHTVAKNKTLQKRLGFWCDIELDKAAKQEKKLLRRLAKRQVYGKDYEEFKQKVKAYLDLEFMQILAPALESYSQNVTKSKLKPVLKNISLGPEIFDWNVSIKTYNVDLVELGLYAHILRKTDILSSGYLFKDRARVEDFYKLIFNEFASNSNFVYKNVNEYFAFVSLVLSGRFKLNKSYKDLANKFCLEYANLDYSPELLERIKELSKKAPNSYAYASEREFAPANDLPIAETGTKPEAKIDDVVGV